MLLDSNIIIYSFQSQFYFLQEFLQNNEASCSAISQVETLGYFQISKDENHYLQECFKTITVYPITNTIIDTAIITPTKKYVSRGCHYCCHCY